jgi:hypothetical protein
MQRCIAVMHYGEQEGSGRGCGTIVAMGHSWGRGCIWRPTGAPR